MQTRPAGNFMKFSTDGMSEQDAMSYWRELYGRFVLKLDVEPVNDHPFRQTSRLQALPNLSIACGVTSGVSVQRTRALVADGNDDLMFLANLDGRSIVSQFGRELDLGLRQATVVSNADMGSGIFPAPMRYLTLGIPRSALADRMTDPESALLRPVAEDNGALRLLVNYVAMTMDTHSPLNPILQPAFVTHVHDLLGLAFGATRDGAMLAHGRGVRAARLSAMKTDILAHLRNEGLSVHDIAKRHRVTPRYVQMLFDGDGRTFSEFLVEQRLTQAYRMLTAQRYSEWTISSIVFEVGFGNLSYFNRTFRRRFGMTPSDARAMNARGDQ
jgi:AraC-like DNA-binding protein